MSDIQVAGFKSSDFIVTLAQSLAGYSPEEKKAEIKKTNGIFELQVSNNAKETATWTIDLKKEGKIYKGSAKPKADVIIILHDNVLTDLVEGKTNGQKAFMTGKLKAKGNVMLATKLGNVLKGPTAKL